MRQLHNPCLYSDCYSNRVKDNTETGNVVISIKLPSLGAPKAVKMTPPVAASDDNFTKTTTPPPPVNFLTSVILVTGLDWYSSNCASTYVSIETFLYFKWIYMYAHGHACRRCSNYIFILYLTPGFKDWAKTSARRDEKHLSFGIWYALY